MKVTLDQLDAIKELFNMGVGRGASILSQMVDSRVHLEVPKVEIYSSSDIESLKKAIGLDESSSVNMTFPDPLMEMSPFLFLPTVQPFWSQH
jgi:chemotaxis protein CheC